MPARSIAGRVSLALDRPDPPGEDLRARVRRIARRMGVTRPVLTVREIRSIVVPASDETGEDPFAEPAYLLPAPLWLGLERD